MAAWNDGGGGWGGGGERVVRGWGGCGCSPVAVKDVLASLVQLSAAGALAGCLLCFAVILQEGKQSEQRAPTDCIQHG